MTRMHLGLLLDKVRCDYSRALGDALERHARERGIELNYLLVDWAKSARELSPVQLDEVLDQAQDLDGMIVMSSVFSHGIKSLSKLTQLWWPRPASSIGYRLPLVPSVVVDNRGAMRAAANHLIEVHRRRSLLFLRGRADSQEATDRYFGFRQALGSHQIINDLGRILQCDFSRASAASAMANLSADLDYDGVICSNDEMAFAVIAALDKVGRRSPEDVAVVGFDDVPAAAHCRPALSTMGQPFSDLAKCAIQLIVDQCEGHEVPMLQEVSARLVQRRSCGCVAKSPH